MKKLITLIGLYLLLSVVNLYASSFSGGGDDLSNNNVDDLADVTITSDSAGQVLVRNTGDTAYENVSVSGDATMTFSGALTIADNSVDGTDIAIGSDAQGDVIYYDGTNYVRLAPGTNGQFLTSGGASANVSWTTAAGTGDITAVGDATSGAAFDGTAGTILTFNNVGGDKTLDYDGTDFLFNAPLSVDASDGADAGAIRLDNAENIAWEAAPAGTDMTLGVDSGEILQYSGAFNATALTEATVAVLNNDEIDASSELLAIMDDETGTGVLMFNNSPTLADDVDLAAAGVRMTGSGGTITLLGLGAGADEDLKIDLDTTANTGIITSSTALATVNFSSIALQESGIAVLNNDEIDASSELLAIMDDETGTGVLTFATSPTFTTSIAVNGTDPADAGAIRLNNAETIAWEASPTGTDQTLTVDSSERLVSSIDTGTAAVRLGGILDASTSNVGNVGVGTDDLIVYTMPANTFNTAGRVIHFHARGTMADNATSKTINLVFGGTTMVAEVPTVSNDIHWWGDATIIAVGANSQEWVATIGYEALDGSPVAALTAQDSGAMSITTSAAIDIKCTAVGSADNDVIETHHYVELIG